MGTREHKKQAPDHLRVGILSISSTRSLADDKSGHWIRKQSLKEGHQIVCHQILPDHAKTISTVAGRIIADLQPHALILTGGTGISKKDVTIEAITPLFQKEMTAFGVLFAQLSFEEIDSAAILSRAAAGIIDNTVVFCIPGSTNACKLACLDLIFPELGHLVKHLQE